ncbi:hypothetical protein ACUOFC_38165, partial [Escherichia sp. TWPC-MK]
CADLSITGTIAKPFSLVSDLELIEDDAKMCTQTITDTASTLKAASEEIQQLVDDLAKSAIFSK